MPIELNETKTELKRASGRTTTQNSDGKVSNSTTTTTRGPSEKESSETTTTQPATVTRTSTRESEPGISESFDDKTLVLNFTIPFQNDEPITPPGETSPSAC